MEREIKLCILTNKTLFQFRKNFKNVLLKKLLILKCATFLLIRRNVLKKQCKLQNYFIFM